MEEENNDYKKYFDPKEYSTKIITVDGVEVPNDKKDIELVTELLTAPQHKDAKEETLLMLKKEKKAEVLLKAIAVQEDKNIQQKLVAACWECEINMSSYLPFFVLLALDNDFLVSLEAITVISEMAGPFDSKQLSDAIQKLKKAKLSLQDEKQVLLNDLIDRLNEFAK